MSLTKGSLPSLIVSGVSRQVSSNIMVKINSSCSALGDTPLPTGSDALKEVDLLIVPKSQCGPDNDDVTPRMLCAKGRAGKDACDSDSGGLEISFVLFFIVLCQGPCL